MKKILFALVIIALLVFGFSQRTVLADEITNILYQSPCDTSVTYRLGSVDPKFGISNQEFLSDIQRAGEIWSRAEGKNLFSYSPQGEMPINLIYDQRQALNSQINQLNSQVQQQKSTLNPQIAAYQKQAADFQNKMNSLNQEIDYWNGRGGAPPDEYNKLKSEQASLQQEAVQLQSEAASLNQSTDQYNEQINQLNNDVGTFNQELTFKPEEGEFIEDNGQRMINIYFDNSQDELVHTLAHELGHSLGMGHNQNTSSIMYPETTQALSPSPDDLAELKSVCQKENILKIEGDSFAAFIAQAEQTVSKKL